MSYETTAKRSPDEARSIKDQAKKVSDRLNGKATRSTYSVQSDHPSCSGYAVLKDGEAVACYKYEMDADAYVNMHRDGSADRIAKQERKINDHLSEIRVPAKYNDLSRFVNQRQTDSSLRKQHAGRVSVKSEPAIYGPGRNSFFRDLYAAKQYDAAARDRLVRHNAATIGTNNLNGAVPPAYLASEIATLVRRHKITAGLAKSVPMPPGGMTVTIPKVTAGVEVGLQPTQNTFVSTSSYEVEDIVVPVASYAGRIGVSWPALDRGARTDAEVMADIVKSYAEQVNDNALHGTGSPNYVGVLATPGVHTITDTDTETFSYNWVRSQVVNAKGLISASLEGATADAVVMHPRRWEALSNELDGNGRPLVEEDEGPLQRVGWLAGLPVHVDMSIPTDLGTESNEDVIIVARTDEWRIADSGPTTFRVFFTKEIATDWSDGRPTDLLVGYGDSSFTAQRYPDATALIRSPLLT